MYTVINSLQLEVLSKYNNLTTALYNWFTLLLTYKRHQHCCRRETVWNEIQEHHLTPRSARSWSHSATSLLQTSSRILGGAGRDREHKGRRGDGKEIGQCFYPLYCEFLDALECSPWSQLCKHDTPRYIIYIYIYIRHGLVVRDNEHCKLHIGT